MDTTTDPQPAPPTPTPAPVSRVCESCGGPGAEGHTVAGVAFHICPGCSGRGGLSYDVVI